MTKQEILLTTQTTLLLTGTGFAWYTVYVDITTFYSIYGTLFKFADCTPANPFTQACFYGAFAFLAGFIWSLRLLQSKVSDLLISQQHLLYLLAFGTVFAWSNFAYMTYSHYHATTNPFTCTVSAGGSLFTTPCFVGSVIFLLSLLASYAGYLTLRKVSSTQASTTKE